MATTAGGIGWRTGVRAGGAEAVVKLRVAHTLVFRSITSLMPGFPPGVDGENVPFRFDLPGAGEARIPGVAPGRYVARGLGSGQAVTIDVREDSPPEIEVALALPTPTPVRVLRLRVVDGVGKPVPNPIAVIVDERRPGCMTARTPHRGDDDGRLDMPDHYPSAIPFRVLAVARGRIGLGDWVVPTAEESVVRLTHATGRIRVRVEDAFTGDVIPGAEVRLIAFSSHLGAGTDRTGATGETRWFEGLAPAGLFPGPRRGLEGLGDGQQRHLPGSYAITVVAGDGYVPARRIVLVEGDRTVRFELDRVPVRSGVVVDRAGRPAAGIRVRLGRATADTGPDGRFMLRGRTSDPLAGPLHWTPFPGDRPGAGGTLLRPEGDLETHVIPDARRWPLEIRLAPADEGLAVRLNPGPGRVFMPAQAFVDQDGVARPGAFLAGAYRMLLLDGLGLVREKDLVLEPAPSDGHWILDLREVGRPR